MRRSSMGTNVVKVIEDSAENDATHPNRTDVNSKGDEFRIQFGIGCFHFAYPGGEGTTTKDEYFDELKKFLLSDNLITDVQIKSNDDTLFIFSNKPNEFTDDLAEQSHLYPYIRNCRLKISFYIPTRVQKEYIGSWREPVPENIELEIDYSDGFPVAYVFTNYTQSPSTAVHILWKHFKFLGRGSSEIMFQMIGPSPFHADFFAQGVAAEDVGVFVTESAGYDEVNINMRHDVDLSRIKDLILYRMTEEISVFYKASMDRITFINKFQDISIRISEIVDDERYRKRLLRLFIGDSATYKIAIDLERFMIDREQKISSHRLNMDYIKKTFDEVILEYKIVEIFSDISEMPVERQTNIVSVLRERHNFGRNNYFVVVAALVGALAAIVAGAIGSG